MLDVKLSLPHHASMARRKKLSDQFREAIDASELSRYRICMETDIDQGAMSRFMAGKMGMTLERLDRVADLLDLRIESGPRTQRNGR